MTRTRTFLFTAIAMVAFAGNSLLCRAALHDASIDAGSFAIIRTATATVTLVLWLTTNGRLQSLKHVDWRIAAALSAYMATFTFAYLELPTGVGALLLFGFAQLTMFTSGLLAGERLSIAGWIGIAIAFAGLVYLLSPTDIDTAFWGALSMAAAGIAWGVYSLLGRGAGNPIEATAGSFLYALPIVLAFSIPLVEPASATTLGVWLAIISGVITSGIGYVIWFAALPHLTRTGAGTAQLSIPVLSATAGIVLLAETSSLELVVASIATLGGIALVVTRRTVD